MAQAVGCRPVIAEFDPKPVHVNAWSTSGTGAAPSPPTVFGFYPTEYHSTFFSSKALIGRKNGRELSKKKFRVGSRKHWIEN